MNDPYSTLGVSPEATDDEIKKAYHKLARKYHPDLNPGDKDAEKKMNEINGAYEAIRDIRSGKTSSSSYGNASSGGRQSNNRYGSYGSGYYGSSYEGFGFGFDGFDFRNFEQQYSNQNNGQNGNQNQYRGYRNRYSSGFRMFSIIKVFFYIMLIQTLLSFLLRSCIGYPGGYYYGYGSPNQAKSNSGYSEQYNGEYDREYSTLQVL